jgi:hypothetical protein
MKRTPFRILHQLALLAIAASLVASTPATADCGAVLDEAVVLCAQTVATASTMARQDVLLSGAVTLMPDRDGTFTGPGDAAELVGAGDMVGVVLSKIDDTGQASGVFFGRVDPSSVGLEIARSFGSITGNQAEGFRLPAGRYRLTLVSKAGEVSATLRLTGAPAGIVHITPGQTASGTVQRLDASFRNDGSFVASDGATTGLQAKGILVRAVYLIAEPHVASRLGTCLFQGVPSQGYQPGCAGAPIGSEPVFTSFFPVVAPTTDGVGIGLSAVTSGFGAGQYGQGVWYESAAVVESAGAVGLWLDLD